MSGWPAALQREASAVYAGVRLQQLHALRGGRGQIARAAGLSTLPTARSAARDLLPESQGRSVRGRCRVRRSSFAFLHYLHHKRIQSSCASQTARWSSIHVRIGSRASGTRAHVRVRPSLKLMIPRLFQHSQMPHHGGKRQSRRLGQRGYGRGCEGEAAQC
jgi:hypothetical protein